MKFIFYILLVTIFATFQTEASPLQKLALKAGMKRAEAENIIALALGKKSEYNEYSMNGVEEGKYNDGETLLIIKYKKGFPAPWIKTAEGKAVHLPPIDAEVISWNFETYKRADEEQAKKLFSAYLKKYTENAADYEFNVKPFRKASWIVSCFTKGLQPAIAWRNLITAKGDVREINDDSLNILFMNEYPLSANTKEDKEKVIKDFLGLYSGEEIIIINKASNIPGYDKNPLDPDLAPAIRAQYVNKDGITVIYTYQKIGGIVRRFRFHWTEDNRFRKAECSKLAKDIGAADYYE